MVSASQVLFGDFDPRKAPAGVFGILAGEVPRADSPSATPTLVEAVVAAGLVKSNGEARRSIEQGGIYLNQQRENDVNRKFTSADWIGGYALLRKGKKDYALLQLKT